MSQQELLEWVCQYCGKVDFYDEDFFDEHVRACHEEWNVEPENELEYWEEDV